MNRIADILNDDVERRATLDLVRHHGPPGAWVGAGYIRDAIWDRLHGRPPSPPNGDVDVIWFDRAHTARQIDRVWQARLKAARPDIQWSVKNQARLHTRNGDEPYEDIAAAVGAWPETATAIAARRVERATEILAPLGYDDLFGLILRPTSQFISDKRAVFDRRVAKKAWLQRYPLLRVIERS